MENQVSKHHKNLGVFIHLSTFSKWFIPFGNFIAPLLLWSAQKDESRFVDHHGRQALNFQLSVLLYIIVLAIAAVPFFIWQVAHLVETDADFHIGHGLHTTGDISTISGLLIIIFIVMTVGFALLILDIYAVVSAAIRASNGQDYNYPLTINFIRETPPASSTGGDGNVEGDAFAKA